MSRPARSAAAWPQWSWLNSDGAFTPPRPITVQSSHYVGLRGGVSLTPNKATPQRQMEREDSSAHPPITFTVPLTLFSQLVFVQAGCAQFPAVALLVMVMVISGVDLNATRPNLDIL